MVGTMEGDRARWQAARRVAALLGVAGAVAAIAWTSGAGAEHGEGLKAPQRWFSSGVDPNVAARFGTVRVRIVLARNALTNAALDPGRRGQLSGRLRAGEVAVLGARSSTGEAVARMQERQRKAALADLTAAADMNARVQQRVRMAVRRAGGHIVEHDLIGNAIVARMPAPAARQLAQRGDVSAVEPDVAEKKLGLAAETAIVGAPSFWGAGYLGGTGPSDASPTDLAIFSDKIQEDHPAFAGVTFVRPPDTGIGTPCGSAFSFSCDHGTAVASAAISRGASGCGQCVPAEADQKGVAPGLDSVLDAEYTGSGDFSELPWALGIPVHVGVFDQEGVADPAEVGSSSSGNVAATDDSDALRAADNVVATYGMSSADPSGNEGPGQSVNTPCIAYNTLCMGGFTRNGTADPTDDTIPDFSSRGPTPAGRKKPDLVGVAVPSEYANRRWFVAGQGLWDSSLEGTSFASPQGAGGMALLAGSGISDPAAQKAILVNSARPGRATPSDPVGTQTAWAPDWGWGALDLDAALAQRTNFETGAVKGGSARFYKAAVQSTGDRATLVWHRRAAGCIGPGCASTAYTLTDLDLHELAPDSGSQHASSQSAIDNVEQVRAPAGAVGSDVIYKVRAASSVDGLAAEPFAIASQTPLEALETPEPSMEIGVSESQARQGDEVSVQASVHNPSADLSAEDAEVTLVLPGGVELAPGSDPATQDLGTLEPSGQPGDTEAVSWSVRGTTDGAMALVAQVQASRYGQSFTGTDSEQLTVDSTPPTTTIAAAGATSEATGISVSWSASDEGVGVKDYDVEASLDSGPYMPWITVSSQTSATYPGQPDHSYRFRARARDRLDNLSAYATSQAVAIIKPGGSALPGPPPAHTKQKPRLRITKIARRGKALRLEGTSELGVRGRVSATFIGRLRGRRVRVSAKGRVRDGHFLVEIRLTKRARALRRANISVTYAGSDAYSRQQVSRRYRR